MGTGAHCAPLQGTFFDRLKPPSAREVPRRGGGRESCHSPKYFEQPYSSLPHRLRAEPPRRGGQGVNAPFLTICAPTHCAPTMHFFDSLRLPSRGAQRCVHPLAPSARGLRPQAVGERTVRLSEIFRAMARFSSSAPSGHRSPSGASATSPVSGESPSQREAFRHAGLPSRVATI